MNNHTSLRVRDRRIPSIVASHLLLVAAGVSVALFVSPGWSVWILTALLVVSGAMGVILTLLPSARSAPSPTYGDAQGRGAADGVDTNNSAFSPNTDSLTGFANRQALDAVMSSLNDSGDGGPVSAILMDIDSFKSINDTHGHLRGDEIIASVASLLRPEVSGLRCVARFGGDEFVLVGSLDAAQAGALAEFLRSELENTNFDGIKVTASFGDATVDRYDPSDDLLVAADKALYSAKTQGRNRVVSSEALRAELIDANRDDLLADFENRVRTYADRMIAGMLHRASELAATLREQAERDALTGIYNRRHLDRILGREFEKAHRDRRALSVALVDLDHFGQVNKTHGFTSGDRVLATAAEAISAAIRANDWLARYGGEEFLVVMPDTHLEDARRVAARVIEALRETRAESYTGEAIAITGTAGVSTCQESDETPADLVERASDLVRAGKTAGRDQYR